MRQKKLRFAGGNRGRIALVSISPITRRLGSGCRGGPRGVCSAVISSVRLYLRCLSAAGSAEVEDGVEIVLGDFQRGASCAFAAFVEAATSFSSSAASVVRGSTRPFIAGGGSRTGFLRTPQRQTGTHLQDRDQPRAFIWDERSYRRKSRFGAAGQRHGPDPRRAGLGSTIRSRLAPSQGRFGQPEPPVNDRHPSVQHFERMAHSRVGGRADVRRWYG